MGFCACASGKECLPAATPEPQRAALPEQAARMQAWR
jgi:hypothetical protein